MGDKADLWEHPFTLWYSGILVKWGLAKKKKKVSRLKNMKGKSWVVRSEEEIQNQKNRS